LSNDQGLSARRAALELFRAALARRGGVDEALGHGPFAGLEVRERAFARALAMTVLRRRGQIERLIEARLQKPTPDAVRDLLRLGTAQLFFMDVASHAAVSTTVELAGERRETRPFKGLVNAILRGMGRDGPPADDPEALAPAWLFARWRAAFGEDDARAMAAMIAEEPATDLTVREAADIPALAEALEAEVLPGGTLRTPRRGELAEWPGYDAGRWWVQDASAAIPARLLAVAPGTTALDMCAAPGGKTLQLAAAGARVTALDRTAGRLTRLAQNFERMGLEVETITADAAKWDDPRKFQAVLLDAPCTSTGAFRRHPDALWATQPPDIAKLAQAQARLLDAAAARLEPGGRLVYCTCSLEPEEGEAQVEAFLRRHPEIGLDPILPGEGGAPPASLTPRGTLRILPHHLPGGTDGFFAARFVALPQAHATVKSGS
jgi:16S rRNA (cytosine967-C5)-methyltransferase